MAAGPRLDDRRRAVWIAFADQFLDTETRPDLPLAALAALDAGLGVEEAREIWVEQVTPSVGANLLSVAGEWAGWDEAWLVERIARRAGRRSWWRRLLGRRTEGIHATGWMAVEGCMGVALAVPPEQRRALAVDLHLLACHYFDFGPRDLGLDVPGRREALRRLFGSVFLPVFLPTVVTTVGEDPEAMARRVLAALDEVPPGPSP
jgi:hypothetical protein